MTGRFVGRVCLVTGGGSGIGRAVCERLAREGGRVAVVDRDAEAGAATLGAITDQGGEARFFLADIGARDAVRRIVDAAVAAWGRVDVLVNNAAVMSFDAVLDLAEADWDRLLAVNLTAPFLFCKYAAPHMPPGSAIVNLSSVHAHRTTANVVSYATSKAGLEALTRGLCLEFAALGIRVNAVAPGAVDTPMLWRNPNLASGAETLTGQVGRPADLAAAIAFLASADAHYVNGATLVVDGGRLAAL